MMHHSLSFNHQLGHQDTLNQPCVPMVFTVSQNQHTVFKTRLPKHMAKHSLSCWVELCCLLNNPSDLTNLNFFKKCQKYNIKTYHRFWFTVVCNPAITKLTLCSYNNLSLGKQSIQRKCPKFIRKFD